ncbi:K(+)/H(+) antiporter [Chromobacterium violaceum]|uniref:K(+)/H(+) antiporter n=1 Tax=Chromobacterium violaceum TaxID=536 RepID=A0A3S4LMQ3_CHRVL|nr:K(+)/H(+) antiporter [Chromobacterium violaceum]
MLETEKINMFALDMDPERVREAGEAGDPVVFGDAGKKEVLLAAGLMRAKVVVVTFADTHAALRILHTVREVRPDLPVIVRTIDESELDVLRQAGADEVVAEVMEGSLMLASQALLEAGVPPSRVLRASARCARSATICSAASSRQQRRDGKPGGVAGAPAAERAGMRRRGGDRPAVGRAGPGRAGRGTEGDPPQPRAPHRFRRQLRGGADDVMVLLGTPEQLALAESRILQGD